MRKLLLSVVLVAGCNSGLGAPSSDVVQSQVEYNMVVADDRARFREQDLSYRGSVGPYAVYTITGADPRLIGPFIQAPRNFGYAMACGAAHYFSAQSSRASPKVTLQLHGGHLGNAILVASPQQPQDQGGCTTPTDTFGNPLPDMSGGGGAGGSGGGGSGGAGPGDGSGGTGCTNIEAPCTPGSNNGGGGASPGDGSGGSTGVQQIGLTFHPNPPVGSTVLVRRVAITAQRQHNGSHVEKNVCCSGNFCSLQ